MNYQGKNYQSASAQGFFPVLLSQLPPDMQHYTSAASTIFRITTIIPVTLAWVAFACWVFYYTILMVGCITLTYLIHKLESGGGNARIEVLDDLEHEEMGVRWWRRKMWTWWDRVTMIYVGGGS
ncbi:hypothetical protein EV426DRAFT_704698 [Tirmania nivea]|nr:hypothetical protein EV426DRAFT_704698 [Tirmania nivea]